MEGLSSFAQLRPGRYIVVRWFGQNHLYRVTGMPVHGRFGWSVRARRYMLGDRDVTVALFEKKLGYPPRTMGGWIFEWFFATKFWPVRMFRPQWRGFYNRAAARDHMRRSPGFGAFDFLALVVCRYLPPRASWVVLGLMAGIVLALAPLHFQLLKEQLEGADAL